MAWLSHVLSSLSLLLPFPVPPCRVSVFVLLILQMFQLRLSKRYCCSLPLFTEKPLLNCCCGLAALQDSQIQIRSSDVKLPAARNPYKKDWCPWEILKRAPKRYQVLALWAWLEMFFHPLRGTNSKITHYLCRIFFGSVP